MRRRATGVARPQQKIDLWAMTQMRSGSPDLEAGPASGLQFVARFVADQWQVRKGAGGQDGRSRHTAGASSASAATLEMPTDSVGAIERAARHDRSVAAARKHREVLVAEQRGRECIAARSGALPREAGDQRARSRKPMTSGLAAADGSSWPRTARRSPGARCRGSRNCPSPPSGRAGSTSGAC